MRLHYSLNSVFFQVIGIPADIRLFLKVIYRIAMEPSMPALNNEEKRVLRSFVLGLPETVREQFKKNK